MRNGDEPDFSVGFSSTSFLFDNFFVSPRCGCRLNCNDEDNDEFKVRKLKLRISCRQCALNSVMVDQLHVLIGALVETSNSSGYMAVMPKAYVLYSYVLHIRLEDESELIDSKQKMRVIACLILRFEFMNDLMKRKWNDSYRRQVVRDVSVDKIIYFSDLSCIENTKMDRHAFDALCNMFRGVGRLEPSRNMGVEEMVTMWFNDVLLAILRCHNLLLKKPQPFSHDRMDERWKWFK
ncbi:hypothetical protein HN51_070071, partial [Arachis hypogaea]